MPKCVDGGERLHYGQRTSTAERSDPELEVIGTNAEDAVPHYLRSSIYRNRSLFGQLST